MEELQSLHELLTSNASSALESAVLNDLASLASVAFPTELDHSQKCIAAVKIIKEIDNAVCLPWFELVSQFLESWRSELSHLFLNTKHNPTKKFVMHAIDNNVKHVNDSCIRLMNWIHNVS